MQLPDVLINYIKEFLPPHPLQKEISSWTRKQYFHKWYFNKQLSQSKKKNINRFVEDNIFWIKVPSQYILLRIASPPKNGKNGKKMARVTDTLQI